MGICALVAGHGIHAFSHGAVFFNTVAHQLQIVSPSDVMERTEVHQNLAVDT